MKVDKTLINSINKQNVLNIIRNNGPIYKAEIARMTGLSIPTIMKITDDFIDKKLIREIGKGESNGGKPPELLELIPDSNFIIGVDIGTTYITAIAMDMTAKIISKTSVPTKIKDTIENVITRISDVIEETIIQSGVNERRILGVGIGMPGILNDKAGKVLFSPDFGWEDIDFISSLRKRGIKLPILIENVTRVMALGERLFGAAKNIDNFICINLGYGIGSAIVIQGELYKGSSGTSGEFGHIMMEKNGPLCSCGNYGCLEALASANAISVKARTLLEKGEKSSIYEIVSGDLASIDAKTVFDAARKSDMLACKIILEATEYIGIAIANTIDFFDPELIILEGGVAKAGEILLENIKTTVASRKMKYAGKNTELRISEMGSDSATIGAAALLLKVLIENGGDVACMTEYIK